MASSSGIAKYGTISCMFALAHDGFKIVAINESGIRPCRDNPVPFSIKNPLVFIQRFLAQSLMFKRDAVISAVLFGCSDNVRKICRAATLLLHLLVKRRAEASGSDSMLRNS